MKKEYKFNVEASYSGFDQNFDRKLERLVGREASTGYDLKFGRREFIFSFVMEDAAQRAFNKLKRFKRNNFRVKLVNIEKEWDHYYGSNN